MDRKKEDAARELEAIRTQLAGVERWLDSYDNNICVGRTVIGKAVGALASAVEMLLDLMSVAEDDSDDKVVLELSPGAADMLFTVWNERRDMSMGGARHQAVMNYGNDTMRELDAKLTPGTTRC